MPAEAMAAYTRSLLEPQMAALERSRGRVAELELDSRRLTADVARSSSAVVALNDELAGAETSRRREARRMALALAVAGAQTTAAGLAPAWAR